MWLSVPIKKIESGIQAPAIKVYAGQLSAVIVRDSIPPPLRLHPVRRVPLHPLRHFLQPLGRAHRAVAAMRLLVDRHIAF